MEDTALSQFFGDHVVPWLNALFAAPLQSGHFLGAGLIVWFSLHGQRSAFRATYLAMLVIVVAATLLFKLEQLMSFVREGVLTPEVVPPAMGWYLLLIVLSVVLDCSIAYHAMRQRRRHST
jgi:hypothetical protein